MPLYRFKCEKCNRVEEVICNPDEILNYELYGKSEVVCYKCKSTMKKLLSLSSEPTVNVIVDKYRNKSVMRNINQVMKKRSRDYHKKYEIGECIEKIGLKTMMRVSKKYFDEKGFIKKVKNKS